MTCFGLRLKTGSGRSKLAAKMPPPHQEWSSCMFMSIIEGTVFSNRWHQQGLVIERKQQGSCVPNEAYTWGQEQQRNWLLHNFKQCTPGSASLGKESMMVANAIMYSVQLDFNTLHQREEETYIVLCGLMFESHNTKTTICQLVWKKGAPLDAAFGCQKLYLESVWLPNLVLGY